MSQREEKIGTAPDRIGGLFDDNVAGLRSKRAEICSEISELEDKLEKLRQALASVDAAVSNLIGEAIERKRTHGWRTDRYFEPSELSKFVREMIKGAKGKPLISREIVSAIISEKGLPRASYLPISRLVSEQLSYMGKRGDIIKIGKTRDARWMAAKGKLR